MEGGTDFRDDRRTHDCPFKTADEVLDFDPWKAYGKIDHAQTIKEFEAHYKSQCVKYPKAVNSTGIYVTCISGLIEIFGWDVFLLAAGVVSGVCVPELQEVLCPAAGRQKDDSLYLRRLLYRVYRRYRRLRHQRLCAGADHGYGLYSQTAR